MNKLKVSITRRTDSDGYYSSIDQIEPIRSKGSREPPNSRKQEIKKTIRKALDKAPKLKKFLEKNNCLGKFIKNTTRRKLEHHDKDWVIKRIHNDINDSNPYPIDCTFCWERTSEGHTYWKNLNDKYARKNF